MFNGHLHQHRQQQLTDSESHVGFRQLSAAMSVDSLPDAAVTSDNLADKSAARVVGAQRGNPTVQVATVRPFSVREAELSGCNESVSKYSDSPRCDVRAVQTVDVVECRHQRPVPVTTASTEAAQANASSSSSSSPAASDSNRNDADSSTFDSCSSRRTNVSTSGDTRAVDPVGGESSPLLDAGPAADTRRRSAVGSVGRATVLFSEHSSSSSSASTSAPFIVDSNADSRTEWPDGYARVTRCLQMPSSERDEERLMENCRQLEQCSFYVAQMTSNEAKDKLRYADVGTFLVRDSANPRFLYSLSVKTRRGVTSIRLAYDSRGFSLDSDQAGLMHSFDTIVQLAAFYAVEGKSDTNAGRKNSCVFLERSGRRDLPVFLRYPYRSGSGGARLSSLKHLSRLAINCALAGRNPDRLVIPPSLKAYIREYPFSV